MASDLNDVLVFARVVQSGSFSAAAQRLTLPKSTVSRRVARLEREVGARLLQRTTRKLGLTDAGSAFYQHCVRILAELDEAERVVSDLQGRPRGTLKLSAPPDFAHSFLPRLLAEYRGRYPEVDVLIDLSTGFVDLVADGYDLALRAGSLRDSSLVARRLASGSSRLFASPGYLRTHGVPVRPSDLAQHDCLVLGTAAATTQWKLTGPRGEQVVEVSGPLASNDLTLLRLAAAEGAGIVNLPLLACRNDELHGKLTRVLRDFSGSDAGLYAVYPTARQLSPKVRTFVDLLVSLMPGFVAELESA